MWHDGMPSEEQCEGCTFFNGQVRELAYLHARDVTYATFCQGPYDESVRYRDFMGWDLPWYSARDSADLLLAGRWFGMLVCYLRDGDQVFETYWTSGTGLRGDGTDLRAARHDPVRQAGDVGGLAPWLAPTPCDGWPTVSHERPSELPVVTSRRGTLRPSQLTGEATSAMTRQICRAVVDEVHATRRGRAPARAATVCGSPRRCRVSGWPGRISTITLLVRYGGEEASRRHHGDVRSCLVGSQTSGSNGPYL